MSPPDSSSPPPPDFSWERWLLQGLSALRRTLFRYDFGLPETFWQHLENAGHELLAAARILLRVLLTRGRTPPPPPEERGPIDIEWD
jgi:hypothetical protein